MERSDVEKISFMVFEFSKKFLEMKIIWVAEAKSSQLALMFQPKAQTTIIDPFFHFFFVV